jgi:superfamily II DNA or RNA helicase
MSYFIDNKNYFELEPENGNGLRECQLGAIWALKSHLTTSSKEIASLISMPTGSGKTALMMAACFELGLGKVLIVVPSKILRRQICEQFKSLQILKDNGCLPPDIPELKVYEIENKQSSREQWETLLDNYDVIVAHPNSISPYYKNLSPIPPELIDAVFIDEAHHEPAPTWQALNKFYTDKIRIFLTATPFRRDRKRMRAKLIYHYSIERAIDARILRPIQYKAEQAGLQAINSDESLLQSALEVFNKEREINKNAAILIRTDRIKDADNLSQMYKEAGLNVDVIHSKRSANVNSQLVKKVIEGKLDGLVCVGIASEGLDIPNLKVAVLHATPRSIPYTIQFLGRISRQPDSQVGSATLVANRDEVRGEVSRLYKSDEAWKQLIPQIIDEQMAKARHYRSSLARENDFQMPELNVFFSALVYETSNDFNYENDFDIDTSSPFEILRVEQKSPDSPLIIVTAYDKPLEWTSRTIYVEDLLDVHIFYHIAESNLLYELTTSELALKSFKKNLIKTDLRRISYGRLYKTLSEFNQNEYIMVGMKNAALRGASQPSYKTLIGNGVQSTVRASEGRVFSTGHALLRLDDENTWGLATKRGRVWAMKRGTAEEFKLWCDKLTQLIKDDAVITTLPGLSFLASSTPINNIDELPIAIIPDDLFFRAHSTTIHVFGKDPLRNYIPVIEPISFEENEDSNILKCKLLLGDYECKLSMNFNSENLWNVIADENIQIKAENSENNVIVGTLSEILNDYPPSLVMPNGSIIEGRNEINPNNTIEELPNTIWKEKNWSNCCIKSERYVDEPIPGKYPVINETIELIKLEFDSDSDIVILDDGAHEVSDLIWFQATKKIVNFIHCKASLKTLPGCRKGDCDVLFAQAARSIHWVFSTNLIDRLKDRLQGNSKIILGNQNTFDSISKNCKINEYEFNIISVQPGFKISQVSDRNRVNNNVYKSAIVIYERILGCRAKLEIWGT